MFSSCHRQKRSDKVISSQLKGLVGGECHSGVTKERKVKTLGASKESILRECKLCPGVNQFQVKDKLVSCVSLPHF